MANASGYLVVWKAYTLPTDEDSVARSAGTAASALSNLPGTWDGSTSVAASQTSHAIPQAPAGQGHVAAVMALGDGQR